jgi:hypothetical protein
MVVIPTNHGCDTGTIVEVQLQKGNKKNVIHRRRSFLPLLPTSKPWFISSKQY